jgi:hypothetical protein
MAERLNVPPWKGGIGATQSGVRIPLSPQTSEARREERGAAFVITKALHGFEKFLNMPFLCKRKQWFVLIWEHIWLVLTLSHLICIVRLSRIISIRWICFLQEKSMNTVATTINGANNPIFGRVAFLILLCGGCGSVIYYHYEMAAGGFTDAQLDYILVAGALMVAGLAILRIAFLFWYAKQPVLENSLVLRDGLFAFRDKDSGLWGLVSSTAGVIAEAQFKDIVCDERYQGTDYIKVVVPGGRTDVFSVSQRRTLVPEAYRWLGHLNDSYHVVTDSAGKTFKAGLYCTNKGSLVVPIEFLNFKMVKDGHAVFYEKNPNADRFDTHFYGLYSIEQQTVVVPTSLRYHRIGTKAEGVFDLGKVVGHTGSRLRILYAVWQNDVYNLEKGRIEVHEDISTCRRHNRDFNTLQETTEEGVLCTYMGVKFLYPKGSRTHEVCA